MINIPSIIKKRHLNKCLYRNKFLFIWLLIEIIILIAYWINDPKIIAHDFYDSVDYLDYANAFNYGWKSFFSDFRAPIYPLILFGLGIKKLDGANTSLYVIQATLHLVSLILFWKIINNANINKLINKIIFILVTLGIDYFWMTKTMLSETTSSLLLMVSIFLLIKWIINKNIKYFYLSTFFYLLLTMTRPFYVYLISIYIFILIIEKIKKDISIKLFILGMFAIFLFCCFIFGYNSVNYKKFKYFGISTEGGINLFSRVAEYPNLLPKKYDKDPKLLEYAQNCRKHNKEDSFSCIWNFYPHNNIPLPRNDSTAKKVEQFSMYALKNNLSMYTYYGLPYFYKTLSDVYLNEGSSSITGKPYDYWYGFYKSQPLTFAFRLLTFSPQLLHYFFTFSIFILGIPISIIYLYTLVKNKNINYKNLIHFVLLGIIFYHVLITGYVATGDMARLILPALPIVYFIAFINLFMATKNIILKFRSKAVQHFPS